MPLLKIQTSVPLGAEQHAPILADASQTVAGLLGKPERYVMVTLEGGAAMLFGADPAPCVYMELKSIGLPDQRCAEMSAALAELAQRHLGVSADRVYIEFADAPRHMWGWNGGTF